MDCTNIKHIITDDIWKHIKIIDVFPLHPKNKILIVQRFIFLILRWSFSIYNLDDAILEQI